MADSLFRLLMPHPLLFLALLLTLGCPAELRSAPLPSKPNIIFILSDDLGYGELGCYGQKIIATPSLDKMADEGMRFLQFYSGNTVCAPSRTVLLTGLHNGHATIRRNQNPEAEGASLRLDEPTVSKVLKSGGYATGAVGKWGLGTEKNDGHPNRQGFDYFMGFLTHKHAHNHFPDFLWRNSERIPLPNKVRATSLDPADPAGVPIERVQYADDLFAEEAIGFVEKHREKPFFLYWSMAIPHANNEATAQLKDGNEVPDYGAYVDKPWNNPQKGHAAMVSRMDNHVGKMLSKLRELNLEEKTLVIFSSDNGHHTEGGEGDLDLFSKNGLLRGKKRDLTEGGIRVPTIAWWPGRIKAGAESNHVGYFGDFLSTAADLAGVEIPKGRDGISFVSELLGQREKQMHHSHLYWEFYERGFSQAVLMDGRWKVIRSGVKESKLELFDLQNDPSESRNIASEQPDLAARAEALFRTEHTEPNKKS